MLAAPAWTHTVSTPATTADGSMVVCRLSVGRLGLDALAKDVERRSGHEDAVRWRFARAGEYAARLLESLRVHLPETELVVHVEDGWAPEGLHVVVDPSRGSAPSRREAELSDLVEAIRERTWLTWWEGLSATMAALRDLDAPPSSPGRTVAWG
jgi:hypothetical protein